MININLLDTYANEYKKRKEVYDRFLKKRLDYEMKYSDEIKKLQEQRDKIKDPIEKAEFASDKKVLNEYEEYLLKETVALNEVNEVLNGSFHGQKELKVGYQSYIALKNENNDGYSIVNLGKQEIIDMSNFEQYKKEFIINMLKKQNSFIGYADQSDLPLLINIYNQFTTAFAEDYDYEELSQIILDEEAYFIDEEKNNKIKDAYNRAIMQDKNKTTRIIEDPITHEEEVVTRELPYINKAEILEVMWNIQKSAEHYLSEEDILVLNYAHILLFDNGRIEDIYLDTPDDEKDYLLKAYYQLSTGKDIYKPIFTSKTNEDNYNFKRAAIDSYDYLKSYVERIDNKNTLDLLKGTINFRTVSPIVNMEILKKEHTKTK